MEVEFRYVKVEAPPRQLLERFAEHINNIVVDESVLDADLVRETVIMYNDRVEAIVKLKHRVRFEK